MEQSIPLFKQEIVSPSVKNLLNSSKTKMNYANKYNNDDQKYWAGWLS